MSVRKFNSGGLIDVALGDCGSFFEDVTWAGLVYMTSLGDQYFSSFDASLAASTSRYAVGYETGKLTLYREGGTKGPVLQTGEWYCVAMRKAAGSAKPDWFVYKFSTEEWDSAVSSATMGDGAVPTTHIRFGKWNGGEQFFGRLAAVGMWDEVLSEGDIHSLVEGTVEDWLALAPIGLWNFGQAEVGLAVEDMTSGEANQTTETNTEVIEEEPPIPYFGAVPGPTVKPENAGEVDETHAVAKAKVNPKGKLTTVKVQWGLQSGAVTDNEVEFPIGEAEEDVQIAEELTGLEPGAAYQFRIVASNADGTTTGAIKKFTTLSAPAAPDVSYLTHESPGGTALDVKLEVNPHSLPTKYWIAWGLTEGSQPEVFPVTPPEVEGGDEGIEETIEVPPGVFPEFTTIYFRVVAENELGEETGEVHEFLTGEDEPPEGGVVLVKVGGELVEGRRYVKVGGSIQPA